MSETFEEIRAGDGHELVVLCADTEAGYRGIIAVHSTALGPAIGGTRFWRYASDDDALMDALRLSRGMTYKNALAGLPFGGGKSVIVGDSRTAEREPLFRAHGRFVERLGGRYITAEDVGTSPADMEHVRAETEHVAGLIGKSGDPSPVTARGVFRAIQASAQIQLGRGRTGGQRASRFRAAATSGATSRASSPGRARRSSSTDADDEKLRRVVAECGAERVAPGEIYDVEADIFAPCALGGVLNDETIPRLQRRGRRRARPTTNCSKRATATALERRGITLRARLRRQRGRRHPRLHVELLGWAPRRRAAQGGRDLRHAAPHLPQRRGRRRLDGARRRPPRRAATASGAV